MIHTDEDVIRIAQQQEAKAIKEQFELERILDGASGKGVITLGKRRNETEDERMLREMEEEAAEIEERNKAERTCVGEVCVFVQNLGMLANDFAYTCTYSQSSKHGLIFTRFHRVCSAMFD